MLLASPATAQSADQQAAGRAVMTEMFKDLFPEAEPLTPEQESRLPEAGRVVDAVFPPGTYARMMEDTMAPMMQGMTGRISQVPIQQLAAMIGADDSNLGGMSDATLGQIMAILDPAFEQRQEAITQVVVDFTTEMMVTMEPAYRAGLVRAYALRFTREELLAMGDFFQTEAGSRYASQSMLIFTDPQVMSVMNEMGPMMGEMLPQLVAEMQEIEARFPPRRKLEDFSADEIEALERLLAGK